MMVTLDMQTVAIIVSLALAISIYHVYVLDKKRHIDTPPHPKPSFFKSLAFLFLGLISGLFCPFIGLPLAAFIPSYVRTLPVVIIGNVIVYAVIAHVFWRASGSERTTLFMTPFTIAFIARDWFIFELINEAIESYYF